MFITEESTDGVSPRTAAVLLTVIGLLGVGLYALSVMVDYKHPDPMYDLDKIESHTPPQLMETPEVFKRKEPQPDPTVSPPKPPATTPSYGTP